ncbi:NADPH-dependent 7-cyano-7-deazaguanine reductase QueF [Pseudoalteromonas sp. SR44-5]|jgi:7-cyano-7-deazaguanine reductase|uniref:NADPH-dependent 7-cyano-7-deazaguanine reductase n=1 Tax=Pseudoalteromonas rhizosphaerae TaxID=2518973 RepID=A0ABW8KXL2_9GAMM|nr:MULTISPECIES: NADPH-dependent 7-cyano-7-deazaguanine reductase QueF [unclassified Pseudoalteromonas]MBB1302336.1 NADPH-dependent 7-cyano-7-deazaguanine reductase QueF [Pseudoalteromonas sp. SR44-8]MBB1310911.1 NADPH-dependent 7-cyano-7-deazaguanine reductase QueF [Pseudoalteromonas sp. SR41-8]MBB1334389.1 NADPH-dependent 7-cyano-7-deazaguanine reductase QueF [Pseudoalteromonas sp. SR41-6]MBB1342123.1 NADPH-dependent 7-cyano-7-deazaguanine reductase QueF [Pseudoalteromonas sp. SR45-6]MBB1366|tara:strand:- start:9569 stop:10414 length:846 start_codon:yes stop_codon:yes gene_type:complete
MTDYSNSPELKGSVLGQSTEYVDTYTPSLLFPIARKLNRDDLNIDESALPFKGQDLWTGYELSWLNAKGKPVVAVATFEFPCQSSHIIESKSFKLYLNSFNQSRFDSIDDVQAILTADLSTAVAKPVNVTLYSPSDYNCLPCTPLPGECIDDLDIEIDNYHLHANSLQAVATNTVTETLHSHLLKSNCLITSQPDWASIIIRYTGEQVCKESLLRYLISFRTHNEFHEQCVERIYCDLITQLKITKLEVYARYTRRGGLDINPYRSTDHDTIPFNVKINRQ